MKTKKTAAPKQFRQGDVYLVEVSQSVEGLKPVEREAGRVVLAHGEVTGHSHAIAAPEATLYALNEQTLDRLLRVEKRVALNHEEHGEIQLPAGTYRVTIQREYEPSGFRNVAD